MKSIDINSRYATPRNMTQIFQEVETKQKVRDISKKYGLNLALLGEFFRLRAQGLQTIDIAEKIGIHRVTVSRYIKALKSMKESEFEFLYQHIIEPRTEPIFYAKPQKMLDI